MKTKTRFATFWIASVVALLCACSPNRNMSGRNAQRQSADRMNMATSDSAKLIRQKQ